VKKETDIRICFWCLLESFSSLFFEFVSWIRPTRQSTEKPHTKKKRKYLQGAALQVLDSLSSIPQSTSPLLVRFCFLQREEKTKTDSVIWLRIEKKQKQS
jgi:hypothetical protein